MFKKRHKHWVFLTTFEKSLKDGKLSFLLFLNWGLISIRIFLIEVTLPIANEHPNLEQIQNLSMLPFFGHTGDTWPAKAVAMTPGEPAPRLS